MYTEIPLMVLEDTNQSKDIENSRGPNEIMNGLYRVKQYIKDYEMNRFESARGISFDQPFQVASERTWLPWDVTNRAFLGQVAGCNLDCNYCFVGKSNVAYKFQSSEEYVKAFHDWNSTHPREQAGVLRISGGEPLHTEEKQNWVAEVVDLALASSVYTWIDTNLTTKPCADLVDCLASNSYVGVCGCFKPGVEGVSIKDQIEVAKAFVEADIDTYFYWPSFGGYNNPGIFGAFLVDLEEVIYKAPLRVTPIHIGLDYTTVRGYFTDNDRAQSMDNQYENIYTLKKFCDYKYTPEENWMPSHHVIPIVQK